MSWHCWWRGHDWTPGIRDEKWVRVQCDRCDRVGWWLKRDWDYIQACRQPEV